MKIFISLFLLCSLAHSEEKTFFEVKKVPGENKMVRGKNLQDQEDQKTKDGFAAQLVVTDDKTIFERWEKPSDGISLKTADKINKNVVFFPLVIFWNPKKDSQGKVRISYDIDLLKPDGTSYAKEHMVSWDGPVHHQGMHLTRNYLAVSIEDKDPFGIYKVKVNVKDEVAGINIDLSSQIEVVRQKKNEPAKLSDQELGKMITYFYKGNYVNQFPEILKQIDAKVGWYDRGEVMTHFYAEVFKTHPTKIKLWGKTFRDLKNKSRQVVADALWLADTKESRMLLQEFVKESKGEDKKYIIELLKKKAVPTEKQIIEHPSHLDNNWGAFMASGRDVFVKNVIKEIAPLSKKKGMGIMIAGSADWSLTSNCQQHPVVLAITERAYVDEQDPEKKKVLEKIVLEGRKPLKLK